MSFPERLSIELGNQTATEEKLEQDIDVIGYAKCFLFESAKCSRDEDDGLAGRIIKRPVCPVSAIRECGTFDGAGSHIGDHYDCDMGGA